MNLLQALPVRTVHEPSRDPLTIQFRRRDTHPLRQVYNGFTGIERRRGSILYEWLIAAGILEKPQMCDVCGDARSVRYHSENYYNPFNNPALCWPCHSAIHLRFRNWDHWCSRLPLRRTGREWFCLLPRTREEAATVAPTVRLIFGDAAKNVFVSPCFHLPAALPDTSGLWPDWEPRR